jgi:hypothetical protein
MNKIISLIMCTFLIINTTGCMTYVNHSRVKQNMAKERIVAAGTQEQKQALAMGVRPTTILAITPMDNGKGAYVGLNMLEVFNPSFWQTAKEAPLSTVGSIVIDASLVGLAAWGIQQATKGDSNSGSGGEQSNTGNGNSNVSVQTGDNSPVEVNVRNGDESTGAE